MYFPFFLLPVCVCVYEWMMVGVCADFSIFQADCSVTVWVCSLCRRRRHQLSSADVTFSIYFFGTRLMNTGGRGCRLFFFSITRQPANSILKRIFFRFYSHTHTHSWRARSLSIIIIIIIVCCGWHTQKQMDWYCLFDLLLAFPSKKKRKILCVMDFVLKCRLRYSFNFP